MAETRQVCQAVEWAEPDAVSSQDIDHFGRILDQPKTIHRHLGQQSLAAKMASSSI